MILILLRFQPITPPPTHWAIAFRTLKLREPIYCIAYSYSTRCINALHITVSGTSTKIKMHMGYLTFGTKVYTTELVFVNV
jgi:hypothetical protein